MNCPLCNNANIDLLHTIIKYSDPFKIDKCNNCNFIFMNPSFCDSKIKSFYDKEYYSGNSEYSYYDEREAKKFAQYVWEKRIEVILKYIDSGNFLDVGSSFGGLLETSILMRICGKTFITPASVESEEPVSRMMANNCRAEMIPSPVVW